MNAVGKTLYGKSSVLASMTNPTCEQCHLPQRLRLVVDGVLLAIHAALVLKRAKQVVHIGAKLVNCEDIMFS